MIAPSVEVKFAGYNAEEHPVTVAGVRAEEVHLIQPQIVQERLRLRYYIIYPSITDIQHIVANLDLSLELGEASDDAFNLRQCQKGPQIVVTLDFRPGSPQKKEHLQFFSVTKGQCQITPLDSEGLAIPGRYFHSMVGLGRSEVLLAGGYCPETGRALDDCYVINTETQTSRRVAPLPCPLYAASLTLVGNKVYLFGGASSALPVPSLMSLSGSLHASTSDPSAGGQGGAQQSPHALPVAQRMYTGPRAAISSLSDAVFVYDIASDSWEQLTTRACDQTLVSLLPSAGVSPVPRRGADLLDASGLNDAARGQRLSPPGSSLPLSATDSPPSVPAARFGHSALAIFDRYIVFFGGRFSKVCANDMFLLDTQTATWTYVDLAGTAPSHRSDAVLIFDGFRCLYVYSGRNSFNSFVDCFAIDLAKGSVSAPGEYREELCSRFFSAARECYQAVVSARDKRYDALRAETDLKASKLAEALQSYSRKAKGLEKERDKLAAELSASTAREAERRKEGDELRAELERAGSRASQLEAQLSAATQECGELRGKLSGAEAEASRLSRALGERDTTIAELRLEIRTRLDETASLKTELVGKDASLAERDREKLELSYSCQELDRQKTDLLAANSALEVEVFNLREDLARLQSVERRHLRTKEEYRRILGDLLSLNDRFDEQEATMLASSINVDRSMNASFTGGLNAASGISGISGAPGISAAAAASAAGVSAGAPALSSNLRRKYPVSAVPGLPVGRDAQVTPGRGEEVRVDRMRPSSARGVRDVSWSGVPGATGVSGAGGSLGSMGLTVSAGAANLAPTSASTGAFRSPDRRAALHSSLVSGGPEVDVLGVPLDEDAPNSAPVPSQAIEAMKALQAGSPIPLSRVPGLLPDGDTPDEPVAKPVSRAAKAAESTGSSVFSGAELAPAKGLLNTVVSPIQSLGN